MDKLNLPDFTFRIKTENSRTEIFDIIRKKFVALTNEEWVRQNIIHYLIFEKGYPLGLIAVEAGFKVHRLFKRADIIVHDKTGNPLMIVECKAPSVLINQEVFDQIARYNLKINVKYLLVTNGLNHYFCVLDHLNGKWNFFNDVLDYPQLENV